MLIRSLIFVLLLASGIAKAEGVSWDASCTPFSDGCLFLLVSKEMHGSSNSGVNVPLFKLAFHAGRVGYASLPGGDLDFAPAELKRQADTYFQLGRDVGQGRLSMSVESPITGLKGLMVAPYLLPEALLDLSQTDVESVLVASSLTPSSQGVVLGRLLAMELNEGKYRFVNGQVDEYLDYLTGSPQPFLAVTSLAITLAEEGYTREAKDIVNRHLVYDDHLRAQDVLLYIQAIQGVFDDDALTIVSLASAIQSKTLRLEALGHLYALTRDQFVGKQYLSALYDFSNPLTPLQRRNLALFAISEL